MSGFSCAVASCLSGITHSFVVSKKGVFTSFDPPGAISSLAATVIPSGAVVGAYTDSGGVGHGGSNPEGDSVGEYIDTAGVAHSFLLSFRVRTTVPVFGSGWSAAQRSGAIARVDENR
jgi:hypothetical protein